ncbi:acyl-CoA dehydrogenase [Mycolicibacterium fortuitum]|uniref:Acyl-CoA dehydrogenase n=2 Tax=Mycolicibacterium fortuitum TaxID=1766 RepID=A0ABD6QI63_MYCFO|nr:acyl-CoA dehydrogenase [Mycolicibacterium fortuitum]
MSFMLYEWLEVETLTKRERYSSHDRETFESVIDVAERLAEEYFAPHNRKSDQNEPVLDGTDIVMIPDVQAALKVYAQTGLIAASMDESVGGMQLPVTISGACNAFLQAANIATAGYAFLTLANSNLLLAYGTEEQITTWAKPMIEGRYFGTMCLSEPGAGSSLADVSTIAEPRQDGTYRIFGNKMWISAGDHQLGENIVHLVLARIRSAPAGTAGLSLFIVPKLLVDGDDLERNDVSTAGLNHKMGFRGTTNAVLNFGEGRYTPRGEAGAVGFLVGETGKGLSYMFHMMNEARIGVGAGATALGYTAFLKSVGYARERHQGRPAGAKDPTLPQVPIIEHPDVRRMLLAQKSYVEGALALILYCYRLVDEHRSSTATEGGHAEMLLDLLTPIAKSWPSQWCLKANALAIQVHGGYGYTRDYDVEQHYRDNRLNAIHEGTHGIQGLDLLGRKVMQRDGAALVLLSERVHDTVGRATGDLEIYASELAAALARALTITRQIWAGGDAEVVLAHASTYLEALGHIVVAWLWLEQMVVADGKDGDFYDGKLAAGAYFFRYELPKVHGQLDLIASLDRTVLDSPPSIFA